MFVPALQTAQAPEPPVLSTWQARSRYYSATFLGVWRRFNSSFTHYFCTDSCLCLLSSLLKFLRVNSQGASDRLSLPLEYKWDSKETADGWTGFDVCTLYLPLLVPSGSSALRTWRQPPPHNGGKEFSFSSSGCWPSLLLDH